MTLFAVASGRLLVSKYTSGRLNDGTYATWVDVWSIRSDATIAWHRSHFFRSETRVGNLNVDDFGNVFLRTSNLDRWELIKYSADGTEEWVTSQDGGWLVTFQQASMATGPAGEVYVADQEPGSPFPARLSRVGSDGSVTWRTYSNDVWWWLKVDQFQSVYGAGLTSSDTGTGTDLVLTKYVQGAPNDLHVYAAHAQLDPLEVGQTGTLSLYTAVERPARDLVNISVDSSLTAPGDCLVSPATRHIDESLTSFVRVRQDYAVRCSSPGVKSLTFTTKVVPNGFTDPNPLDNESTAILPLTVNPQHAATHNKVLFVAGIQSNSSCNGGAYADTQWMRDALSQKWNIVTGLNAGDFLYYDYTVRGDSPDSCTPYPTYNKSDTIWSLDDTSKAWFDNSVKGQADRLADYLDNYFASPAHVNDRVTIVGHSQGGYIASLMVADYASFELKKKIRAVVTLDSPLGGVPKGSGLLAAWAKWGCFSSGGPDAYCPPEYDSPNDLETGSQAQRRLSNISASSVPLYTVNAEPGKFDGIVVADDAHSQLPSWPGSHISVDSPGHVDVWDGWRSGDPGGQRDKLLRFVVCGIIAGKSQAGKCSDFANSAEFDVQPNQIVYQTVVVTPGGVVQRLKTITVWPGSTVRTTLVSPSGRRIDGTTTDSDVTHASSATGETFSVDNPEAGTWSVELYGQDVAAGGETVSFSTLTELSSAVDADDDGSSDSLDNCPGIWNPGQSDIDNDGVGDLCDPDIDDDGVANATDNCESAANPLQEDRDQNGLGDACDPDSLIDTDADGIADGSDNCPIDLNPDQSDVDGDGAGDVCDPVDDRPATPTPTPTDTATATDTATPTDTPTTTPTPTPVTCADLNGDRWVTAGDVVLEALAILRRSTNSRYDLNGDSQVNLRDLVVVLDQLGRRC